MIDLNNSYGGYLSEKKTTTTKQNRNLLIVSTAKWISQPLTQGFILGNVETEFIAEFEEYSLSVTARVK